MGGSSTATQEGDVLNFCITKGRELNKSYVLPSVVQSYDMHLIGPNKDTLLVKERITYNLLALRDISEAEDIFKEGYSSKVALRLDRWYGTDHEEPLHMGASQ